MSAACGSVTAYEVQAARFGSCAKEAIVASNKHSRVAISTKIFLIILTYTLLTGATAVGLISSGINKDIAFADQEKCGNTFQKPLETILELVPQHQVLVEGIAGGKKESQEQLNGNIAKLDQAFTDLEK